MNRNLTLSILFLPFAALAQETYFPPTIGTTWETTDPAALGWCTDQLPPLLDFLDGSNSKAFIVLKDGRIVIEEYFGTFTQDSLWYWASAGKSLTAFLVGLAQEDGLLDIDEPSSTYLGDGWTSCTPEQEAAITIRDQLQMTTGLDEDVVDDDCTDPECLQYRADPGTRWAYHNAPYTRLDGVLEAATGQSLNSFVATRLGQTIGLSGFYFPIGFNNVFISRARSMARFGLLAMNGGNWNGTPIMTDTDYFTAMTTPSQSLNPAYGYLWWLNGQASYLLPGVDFLLPGPLMPDGPMEAFSAMGKNGQLINVVPSQGLVVVRMGDLPGGIFVPNVYNNDIWQRLNAVICTSTSSAEAEDVRSLHVYPNPAVDRLAVTLPMGSNTEELLIVDAVGRVVIQLPITSSTTNVDLGPLAPGSYRCILNSTSGRAISGFVKE